MRWADRELLELLGKTHAASFQVLVADQIWGDLYVTRSGTGGFGEEDCAAGLVLVGLLAAGLSRLELLAELSSLAYTDPLTKLANRRAVDEWMEQRMVAAQPFPLVSAVLCDIDGLKRVNDAFGHNAGDELVRLAAAGSQRPPAPSTTPWRPGSAGTSSCCSWTVPRPPRSRLSYAVSPICGCRSTPPCRSARRRCTDDRTAPAHPRRPPGHCCGWRTRPSTGTSAPAWSYPSR